MEAKLANMQSRKPSDEDYVPGQSFRVDSPSSAAQSQSGEEMDLEEELGLDEGRKAAEELEREMEREMGASPAPTHAEAPGILPTTLPISANISSSAQTSPHPTSSTKANKPSPPATALPKGLANLPKKPSFL